LYGRCASTKDITGKIDPVKRIIPTKKAEK